MAGLKLIGVYAVLVLIGDLIAYGVGRATESLLPSASMTVFLGLFFLSFWAAWKVAVRFA